MNVVYKYLISILLLFILACPVFGHVPIWSDKAAIDPNTAIVFIDPNISQVAYRTLPPGPNQIWSTFKAHAKFSLYVQIGVPAIDRYKNFRPSLAVIGPGLPQEAKLPFKIPSGNGSIIIDTNSVEPRFFHEPFTGTDSWILTSKTMELPASGQFFIVAYDPKQAGGKLWVSAGQKERFGLADLLNMGQTIKLVRSFHEVQTQAAADPNNSKNKDTP
jgi:hypothetical protein